MMGRGSRHLRPSLFTRHKKKTVNKKRSLLDVNEREIFVFIRLPCLQPSSLMIFYYEILSGKFIKIFPLFFGFLLWLSHCLFCVMCLSTTSSSRDVQLSVVVVRMDVEKYENEIEKSSSQWGRWKFLSLNPHHHRRHPLRNEFLSSEERFFFGAGTSPVSTADTGEKRGSSLYSNAFGVTI